MKRRGLISLAMVGAVALALLGCSDDSQTADAGMDFRRDAPWEMSADMPPGACALKIARINSKDVSEIKKISAADDQNTATANVIDLDIEVTGTNLSDGATLTLKVSKVSDLTELATSGMATFAGVPVPVAGQSTKLTFRAEATGCTAGVFVVDFESPPTCVFIAPMDGATLGAAQDADLSTPGFQYAIEVQTQNAEGGTLGLNLAGSSIHTEDPIASGGRVTHTTNLQPGENKLEAEVERDGVKTTCAATVTVSTSLPTCTITLTPQAVPLIGSAVGQGLGVAQDAQASTPTIENNIIVKTVAGAEVSLLKDGQFTRQVTADGNGDARFDLEELQDGVRTISATCVAQPSGNDNQATPVVVTVDSVAPAAANSFTCTVSENRRRKVKCTWTSAGPADIVQYRVRYSTTAPITDATWAAASATEIIAPPFPNNTSQSVTFPPSGGPELVLGTTYYFAVRGVDKVENLSAIATKDDVKVDFNSNTLVGIPQPNPGPANWGAVMVTGDFDCDGFTDLAVGDQAATGNKGRVAIYTGSQTGFLSTPTKLISGTVAAGRFGAGLAALESFKGTAGCNDLAVVASHDNTSAARVFVYFGRANFFDRDDLTVGNGAELVLSLPAAAGAGEKLGETITNAGDLNGDGYSDLAISYRDTGSADTAAVVVVYGDSTIPLMASGLTPTAVTIDVTTPAGFGTLISGGKASESFGLVLGGGASLDGDAYSELLIGAPKAGKGAVYVVKGAAGGAGTTDVPLTDARVSKIGGGTSNFSFGDSIAYVGDMDGDGSPEFAVADSSAGAGGAGMVYVFNLKGATPPASPTDAVFEVTNDITGAAGDAFGSSIAAGDMVGVKGGDINNDGKADLVVGATAAGTSPVGAIYIFYGKATLANVGSKDADFVFNAPADATSYGATVVFGKDFNSNSGAGFNDIAVGDPLFAKSTPAQTVGRISYYY
ncbi:MAG: hypothetical protein CSA65_05785 [Proteobacteria bacterium]|nr:MAG: hypothetical protein CSB49_02120 [Pseudomonadota bacterium]PIE18227.1 MAG: hypothetical protein CSA65_05785 [Pseudomonadota bacterium]